MPTTASRPEMERASGRWRAGTDSGPRRASTARILRALVEERRRELTRSLHGTRSPLSTQLEKLRYEADAYREQMIALNAKLAAAEGYCLELRGMREQIVSTSARLDTAVNDLVEDVIAVDPAVHEFATAVTNVRKHPNLVFSKSVE